MTRERIEFPDGKHVPRKSRARLRWPAKTTPPRCAGCSKQPPACICPKEES